MKILVVGGSGMIGGHAALHLQSLGHDVSIASRHAPQPGTPLAALPFVSLNYLDGVSPAVLKPFEALVFAAGSDVRHVEGEADAHWIRANVEGVPRFFAQARDAGLRYAINIGSFYPQVRSSLVDTNAYVRSRHLADVGARALTTDRFRVISLNAPFVVGHVPGLLVPMFQAYTRYARGLLAGVPRGAPLGGVNFISTLSLAQAVDGALQCGEPGRAYLIGDQNLSFADYFAAFFEAAGDREPLPLLPDHPLMPDSAMLWGAASNFFYEPDADEVALLGYARGDIRRAIAEIVAAN